MTLTSQELQTTHPQCSGAITYFSHDLLFSAVDRPDLATKRNCMWSVNVTVFSVCTQLDVGQRRQSGSRRRVVSRPNIDLFCEGKVGGFIARCLAALQTQTERHRMTTLSTRLRGLLESLHKYLPRKSGDSCEVINGGCFPPLHLNLASKRR